MSIIHGQCSVCVCVCCTCFPNSWSWFRGTWETWPVSKNSQLLCLCVCMNVWVSVQLYIMYCMLCVLKECRCMSPNEDSSARCSFLLKTGHWRNLIYYIEMDKYTAHGCCRVLKQKACKSHWDKDIFLYTEFLYMCHYLVITFFIYFHLNE